jgi:hypothetical protein
MGEKKKSTPEPKASNNKAAKQTGAIHQKATKTTSKKPDVKLENLKRCSFCNSPPSNTRFLLAGPNNIFICEYCVGMCVAVFYEGSPIKWRKRLNAIMANPQKPNLEE